MMKEPVKPKPKTILDDLDDQILYDKPERTVKPASRPKPVIKHVEVLDTPLNKEDIIAIKSTNFSEPAASEIETESLNFDDDFVADNFSNSTIPSTKSSTNGTSMSSGSSVTPSTNTINKSTNGEDLNQYIGDVSNYL